MSNVSAAVPQLLDSLKAQSRVVFSGPKSDKSFEAWVLSFLEPLSLFLATTYNSTLPLSRQADAWQMDASEARLFIGMLVDIMVRQPGSLRQYLNETKLRDLAPRRWRSIVHRLKIPITELVELCNFTFKQRVDPPSAMVLDETIWKRTADEPDVVDTHGKPIRRGVKVFNLSFRLDKTNRSYCYHFVPDLGADRLTVSNSLDAALSALPDPSRHVITADRWFGSIRWALAHPEAHVVMRLAENQENELITFMLQGMHKDDLRLFAWRHLILSLWLPGERFCVLSSAHSVTHASASPPLIAPPIAAQRVGLPPRLSVPTTCDLAVLPLPSLQELCRLVGAAPGGNAAKCAEIISRRAIPMEAITAQGISCLSFIPS